MLQRSFCHAVHKWQQQQFYGAWQQVTKKTKVVERLAINSRTRDLRTFIVPYYEKIKEYHRSMEYKLITENRFEDVMHHLRHTFFVDEPLNKAVGLCRRGSGNSELERLSCETLKHNLCLMAVDEHDAIAGVVLNGILNAGDVEGALEKLELSYDEKFKKIFRLLYELNTKADMFRRFNIDQVFDVRILSVDPCYRGKGIAKELLRRSVDLARERKFKFMKADATGIFSQKTIRSCGFELLCEQYYSKYTDDSGQPILPVEAPHLKLQLLYKQLNNEE